MGMPPPPKDFKNKRMLQLPKVEEDLEQEVIWVDKDDPRLPPEEED